MQDISPISELEEEGFIKFLQAIPDAIVFINTEGDIVFINAQTEQLFGYSRDNLVGQKLEILIPESYRSRHPEHRNKYFASPKIRPMGGSGMHLMQNLTKQLDGKLELDSVEGTTFTLNFPCKNQ